MERRSRCRSCPQRCLAWQEGGLPGPRGPRCEVGPQLSLSLGHSSTSASSRLDGGSSESDRNCRAGALPHKARRGLDKGDHLGAKTNELEMFKNRRTRNLPCCLLFFLAKSEKTP